LDLVSITVNKNTVHGDKSAITPGETETDASAVPCIAHGR
jgi:hypothetical protein